MISQRNHSVFVMEKLINVKQVSLHFNLREPKGNKSTSIYAVLRIGNRQRRFSMGYKINSWQWDKKAEMPSLSRMQTQDELVIAKGIIEKITSLKFAFSEFFIYLCQNENQLQGNEIVSYFEKQLLKYNNLREMANNGVANVKREKSATKALMKALELYPTVKDGVEPSTLITYGHQVKAFCRYCEEIKRNSIRMFTNRGLNDFEIYLRTKGESATKIHSSMMIVRNLVNKVMCKHPYFKNYGIEPINVSLPKVIKSEDLKVELLDEEIKALRECKELTPTQKEYRDLFLLIVESGQRASDLWKFFDSSWYSIEDGYFVYRNRKKKVQALVEQTGELMKILNKYNEGLQYVDVKKPKFSASLTIALKTIAKKSNLDRIIDYVDNKKVNKREPLYEVISSHFGRHTFITRKVRKGVRLDTLKLLTGHKREETLREYYIHLNEQDKL